MRSFLSRRRCTSSTKPAATIAASAVLVTFSAGHCTVVDALDCSDPPLLAVTVAVLAYAAQLDADVALLTCTVTEAPAIRLPKLQLKTRLAMAHVPGPLYAGPMLQLTPGPAGSGSFSVTAVAVPVHATALLLTKLDECCGLGNILPLVRSSKLPLSYLTNGQNVPDDIEVADCRRLARLVLGAENDSCQ